MEIKQQGGGFDSRNITYLMPTTLQAAMEAFASAGDNACIMAGGTDVMVELEEGKRRPDAIIDIMNIAELKHIGVEGDALTIGAAVTLTEIVESEIVQQHFPALAKACSTIGSLQIQNSATLIGNVVTGQPAADGAMALASLNPRFTVVSSEGERSAEISEMYSGFGKSTVGKGEIVSQIRIPLPAKGEAAAFYRLVLRENLSLPMLNTSAMVKIEGGKFVWARIAMGPTGVGPTRATEAEEWLAGKEVTAENLAQAGVLSLNSANPRSNPLRGSKEYREQTLPVIVRRVLEDAVGQ